LRTYLGGGLGLVAGLTGGFGFPVAGRVIGPLGRNLKDPPYINIDKAHRVTNGNLRRGKVGRFRVGTTAWRDRGTTLDRKTEKIQGS
jgi:hypothetical protein